MSLLSARPRYHVCVRPVVITLLAALALPACDGDLRFDPNPTSDASIADATSGNDASTPETTTDTSPGGCTADSECPFSTLHCDPTSRTCVACWNDSHCGSGDLRRCDVALHRCVECGVSSDCEYNEVCDPATKRCRSKCTDASTCPSTMPVCDTTLSYCTCTTSETCESSSRRRCSPTTRTCVECLTDIDCLLDDEKHCFEGYCVHCTTDAQCSPKRCEPVTHQCVD